MKIQQLIITLLLAIMCSGMAMAATITVDTLDDVLNNGNGDCSLRDAITAANSDIPWDNCPAGDGADVIEFSPRLWPGGTIALQDTLPVIFSDLVINGPGRDILTISGEDSFQVMSVHDVYSRGITVSINHLTLANGFSPGGAGLRIHRLDGQVSVALNHCRITRNTSDTVGGGIASYGAVLDITDCEISHNHAIAGDGGGVHVSASGVSAPSFSLTDSSVHDNSAGTRGGGVYIAFTQGDEAVIRSSRIYLNHVENNIGGSTLGGGIYTQSNLSIEDSVVESNAAVGNGYGGGIEFFSGGGIAYDASVMRSIIRGNSAYRGGAIYNSHAGSLTVTDSTVSNNSAISGGSVLTNFADATFNNVTMSGNNNILISYCCGSSGFDKQTFINYSTIAGNEGSTFFVHEGRLELYATVIAHTDNPLSTCGAVNPPAIFVDRGWNLVNDTSCPLTEISSMAGIDPLLGPLQDNGGYRAGDPSNLVVIPTYALLENSPAIDASDNINCPATDQRGVNRPLDGDNDGTANCDIGAVEFVYVDENVQAAGAGSGGGCTINSRAPFDPVLPGLVLISLVYLGRKISVRC